MTSRAASQARSSSFQLPLRAAAARSSAAAAGAPGGTSSAGSSAGAAVLVLEGLLPARDYLIDLPGIQAAEFHTERHRIATGRPRWHSLLQPELLRQLADDCPGAATFRRLPCSASARRRRSASAAPCSSSVTMVAVALWSRSRRYWTQRWCHICS